MGKLFIHIGAIVVLACLSHGVYAAEVLALASGKAAYAYEEDEVPLAFRKDLCFNGHAIGYVFAASDFSLLEDGRYILLNGSRFVADDSCLFLPEGEAVLADGAEVEFYQKTGSAGNLVLRRDGETYRRVYNERLRLKNGEEFFVEPDGYFWGLFNGEHIFYPDKDEPIS